MLAQTALKYDVEVNKDGLVELAVFVLETSESFADLLFASESSLAFWDNPLDDKDWNNA